MANAMGDSFIKVAVPSIVSITNFLTYTVLPRYANWDSFEAFSNAYLICGFYLSAVASGSANILMYEHKHQAPGVTNTYNCFSAIFLCVNTIVAVLLENLLAIALLAAYYLQQNFGTVVTAHRYEKDGLFGALLYLILPACIAFSIIALALIEISQPWTFGILMGTIFSIAFVIICGGKSFISYLHLDFDFEYVKPVMFCLTASALIPVSIFLDIWVFDKAGETAAEGLIFTKLVYSVPIALTSLFMLRTIQEEKAGLHRFQCGVALLAAIATAVVYAFYDRYVHPLPTSSMYGVTVYAGVFALFNFFLARQIVLAPTKTAFVGIFALGLLVFMVDLAGISIEGYLAVKLSVMILFLAAIVFRGCNMGYELDQSKSESK